ncbi:TetR/AcrR family transcriptional regulator [Myxosarcina sp. GI1]|uniref:TetR/AcrR family transcriptional regulator n=1 Tax=Myxosarcina sp. GI1 TaxID=1541065 RepID=UPI00055AF9AB|nr:TetR/AcrR family transcriptional regulator [Myxosarcina sp. GI1]
MNSTKTQILDTAQELIQRVGLNAMSYADISKAVNIRKASIHYHFPTKEKLVAALLDRFSDDFFRLVDSILKISDTAEVKLRRYCGLFEATLSSGEKDKACLCGMLGAEFKTLESSSTERVSRFYQDNRVCLIKLLQEGQETGEFKFPGQTEAMAITIFSSLEGGLLIARADGGISQFRSIVEQLIVIVKG